MGAARQPQLVTLRSGDVVRIRQVRPDDAPALARAYANLGEQSRYRRFFTVMPELPDATLKAAVEVDHVDQEALVAVPLLSTEIVGESRFIRLPDQPGTAEVGVTVVDGWQGRGLGSALLARLSECAAAAGIEYFTAEILAENRTMLALLPGLGQVETESSGPVVTARVELGEPSRQAHPDLLDLLTAAARGDIVSVPVLLRQLIRVPEGVAHIILLPVSAVLKTWRAGPRTPDAPPKSARPREGPSASSLGTKLGASAHEVGQLVLGLDAVPFGEILELFARDAFGQLLRRVVGGMPSAQAPQHVD
jgi:RimJ/RimL family protein N-acetyltransferase